ncbi:hypothetical protein G6N74_02690 [Mesorhizobium sp. CGMCC 1.15528]|uniref:Aldose 1-epimerase family protein n=1 Tax=Mesorhizobium zhangyense TaxID=1776730 RepID=A0A7C9V4Y4_9HYPH|nr:hypothetical protein [Mesorhizobium zhangyense]NGN39963.1 hypothetical protein [Mesorhizobium zhangyense]
MLAPNDQALSADESARSAERSRWALSWDRGHAEIFAVGGSLHNLTLVLDDGSSVMPLAEAPWINDPKIAANADIPAHLRQLGGEWACVPFGKTPVDPHHHGYGTNNAWHVTSETAAEIALAIDYPSDHPIKRVERHIAGVPGEAAVEITLTVEARADCLLPVGLHPIFRMPEQGKRLLLDPGVFSQGHTFPEIVEPGVSRLKPDDIFASLEQVPLENGSVADLSSQPSGLAEEIIQIDGASGCIRILYPDDGYRVQLDWNRDDFPAALIWLSDRGRSAPPWSSSFRGVGIEPVNAWFDDTRFAPQAPDSLSLGRNFTAGERWTTRYRISASRMDASTHEGTST